MKKYFVGIFSLVLAVSICSFTNSIEKSTTFYYYDGAEWKVVPPELTICPSGTSEQCELEIDNESQPIYTSPDFSSEYLRS